MARTQAPTQNYHFMQYCKHTLDVTIMSDFMNRDTNKLFTETEWRAMIDKIHFKKTNQHLPNLDLLNIADKVMKIQKQIPRLARRELRREHHVILLPGDKVTLSEGKHGRQRC